ncbi:MAG: hypothetical protein JSR90_17715 [Proteobacteria bacterium]|nr:hypothetical protein [Pseudomonadota bacterium]
MRKLVSIALGAAILVPAVAQAQMSDGEYCSRLSYLYRTYVGANRASGNVPEALAMCDTNPAAAIPVLERALTDAQIDLPRRN